MSDASHELYEQTRAAKVLIDQLRDLCGDDADEELVRDSVEGETELHEAIEAAVKRIGDDLAAVEALETYIKKLTDRRDRLKERVAATREAIASAMELARLQKLETPFATVAQKKVAPKVLITDEAEIPSDFFKPQDPKLDRKAVLDALKAKQDVPGAQLSNGGMTINVRFT